MFSLGSSGSGGGGGGGGKSMMKKSKSQQTVSHEVFKDHWKQAQAIFNKNLVQDDDIEIVKNNLTQMIFLLMDELNTIANLTLNANKQLANSIDSAEINNKFHGPIWSYLICGNIFETVYLWSLSYPEYLHDLKCEQLKYYESLINHMQSNEQTNLLLYSQLYRPLFSLLNHCSTHSSEEIERHCIAILNQLCVCICKNSNLLNIFFDNNNNSNSDNNNSGGLHQSSMATSSSFILNNRSELIFERSKKQQSEQSDLEHQLSQQQMYKNSSKVFIFNLLIPYIHKEGCLGFKCGSLTYGQQARDTLLMIMQLSSRNSNLAKYIVDCTDFCPILATGLSGLYSELPQKFSESENNDEVHYLQKEDIINIPSLNKFINSLEFCNNVIQVSHALIANQLLQYIYYGFLVPVCAPALTQNCKNEIVVATCYLDLFLRTVNEPNLLKLFLKFILYAKFDERFTLLDTLIARINSCDKLSLATLMLFYTMIELNSEDVMYKLVFMYLVPGKHLTHVSTSPKSKKSSPRDSFSGFSVQTLFTMSTHLSNFEQSGNSSSPLLNTNKLNYVQPNSSMYLNENYPINRWLNSIFDPSELVAILSVYDQMRFNFIDYLKEAKCGIDKSAQLSLKWLHNYDTLIESSQANFTSNSNQNMENTVENNKKANFSNSPPSAGSNNNHLFHELGYDPDEFLFNLKINSSSLEDPNVKTACSTINLFGKEEEQEDDIDDEIAQIQKSDKKQVTSKRTVRKAVSKSSPSTKKLIDKSIGSKQATRNHSNDFYVLSFDNELSETESGDSSNSSSPLSMNKSDNEDNHSTTASLSSTATINNDSSSSTPSKQLNQSSSSLDSSAKYLTAENHDKLVEYLFLDEENKNLCLNRGLTEFLDGLDKFFRKLDIKITRMKQKDISLVIDKIFAMYNEALKPKTKTVTNEATVASPERVPSPIEEENEITHTRQENVDSNLTTFPVYNGNDSFNSSTDSINTNSQAVDSGIESTKDFASREADIGPFLSAILNRLDGMLANSLEINLIVTGLISRLAHYHQNLIRKLLLDAGLTLQPNIKSLIQILGSIKGKIEANAKNCNNFSLLYLKAKLHMIRRLMHKSNSIQPHANQLLLSNNHSPQAGKSAALSSARSSAESSSLSQQGGATPAKKKSSPFKMNKILSIFFKPASEITPASVASQATVFRNEAFGFGESLERVGDQCVNSESSSRSLFLTPSTPNSDKYKSDFVVEINPAFTESTASPVLNDVKMNASPKIEETAVSSSFSSSNETKEITQSEFYDFIIADNEWLEPRARNLAFSAVIFDEFVKELAAICQEHCVFSY